MKNKPIGKFTREEIAFLEKVFPVDVKIPDDDLQGLVNVLKKRHESKCAENESIWIQSGGYA